MVMQYDAVVLAGGVTPGELKKVAPYENEALIIIGNYPMIYYIMNALRASSRVRRVCVCAPPSVREVLKQDSGLLFAEPGEDAIDSFINGLHRLQEEETTSKVLVLAGDIPFLTTEALDDFVSRCEATEADFYYPVTSKQTNEAKFPGVNRTYVKLQDGTFTGGNLFVIRSSIVDQVVEMGKKQVANRKSPLAMARLLGIGLVWRYLCGQLNIQAVEKRFKKVMGITGISVVSPYAEVGVDVDKQSDLELAERVLGQIMR
ncbi:MAG: nucleotidyltransferase family protein [Methylocystaceae bacterium]